MQAQAQKRLQHVRREEFRQTLSACSGSLEDQRRATDVVGDREGLPGQRGERHFGAEGRRRVPVGHQRQRLVLREDQSRERRLHTGRSGRTRFLVNFVR